MPDQTQLIALDEIARAAVASESATGMPAAVTAAQCIIESSWLMVCPGNNCFGIKATDTSETYQFTHEYIDGKWEEEKLAFEAYPTLAACFTAHARLLQGGRYAASWAAYMATKNINAFIRDIGPIYATAPRYAIQVIVLAQEQAVTAAIARARKNA